MRLIPFILRSLGEFINGRLITMEFVVTYDLSLSTTRTLAYGCPRMGLLKLIPLPNELGVLAEVRPELLHLVRLTRMDVFLELAAMFIRVFFISGLS
jgi:hypothetical protein